MPCIYITEIPNCPYIHVVYPFDTLILPAINKHNGFAATKRQYVDISSDIPGRSIPAIYLDNSKIRVSFVYKTRFNSNYFYI